MDIAKRLADWRDQPPEQWLGAANHYLPPGAKAVLVIAIAYQLAMLTWTLVPGSTPVVTFPSGAVESNNARSAPDYRVLIDSRLFGETAEQPQVVATPVVDAPATTLNLTLRGILSKEGDPNGSVIIESTRGEMKTYFVGQTVEGADGATLHSVYADRVLLNRAGRLETLALPKDLPASGGPIAALTPSPQVAPASDSLRAVLTENAGRLSDIITPVPHVQEGQVIGFRVTPGRDHAAFEALGLRSGDVVTDINGTVLNDVSQGLQVVESLGESTQANVTVLRDGVPQVIVIETSQLQRLRANRE